MVVVIIIIIDRRESKSNLHLKWVSERGRIEKKRLVFVAS